MYKILTIKNKRFAAVVLAGGCFLSVQSAMASSVFLPNGFYLSGGSMDGYVKADNVKVVSSDQTVVPRNTGVSRFGSGGFFALGYGFASTPARLAVEYTHRPKVSYSANPIFKSATEPQKINSTLINNTIILNAYYDFHFFNKVSPLTMFLKGGVGYARNRTSSRITYRGGTPVTTAGQHARNFVNTYAWDAGLGLRYRIMSNIFVSLMGQYVDMNEAKWGPWHMGGSIPQDYALKAHTLRSIEGVLSLDIFLGKQQQPPPGLINDGDSSKNPALINDDLQEDTIM
ncbi:MAG: outer membrane beta-barrel protein [Pseudomonadota bacterium]|mgnify:FL=1